jgi:glycerate kinase
VVAVAGRCEVEPAGIGLKSAYALLDVEPDIARCFADTERLLVRLAGRIAGDWLEE